MSTKKKLVVGVLVAGITCIAVFMGNTIHKHKQLIQNKDEIIDKMQQHNEKLEDELQEKEVEIEKVKREKRKEVSRGVTHPVVKPVTFNTSDLRVKSNITHDKLYKRLKNNGGILASNTEDFIKAEEKYGVNAIFLSSLAIQESGWGKSGSARYNNNIFGWGRGKIKFSSKAECIDTVAKSISENYLTAGGKYHKGYSLQDMSIIYCGGDPVWVRNITNIGNKTLQSS